MVTLLVTLALRLAVDPSVESCANCHAAETEQWRHSPHAGAREDPLFLASWSQSRLRWCVDCHAPPVDTVDGGVVRGSGVDCAACHLRGGAVVTRHLPTPKGVAAHPMARDENLGNSSWCAPCHQFNVPVSLHAPIHEGDQPMQDTFHEWQQSPSAARGVSCQGCHMREGTHDMEGAHDVDLVRRTVSMQFSSVDGGWTASLVARGAAHRVPTGDPFRRFELTICTTPDCSHVLAVRQFGREFAERRTDAGPGASQFVMTGDFAAHPHLDGGAASPPRFFNAPASGFSWKLQYRLDEPGLRSPAPENLVRLHIHQGVVDGGMPR